MRESSHERHSLRHDFIDSSYTARTISRKFADSRAATKTKPSKMNKQDIQIDELNSHIKAKIAPSKIHGIGVMAIRDLISGEKLYADLLPKLFKINSGSLKKLFPEVWELILERWPRAMDNGLFISPDVRLLSFMNHSDNPSYDPTSDCLLRDVKKNEEIMENYRLIPNYEKAFPWLI